MPKLFSKNGAKCTLEYLKKKASVALTDGDMVTIDSNGYVLRLTDGDPILGVVRKTITSASDDYASNTLVPVEICGDEAEYQFDVSTGTPAQTDVGEYVDADDHNSIDVDASTNDLVLVTRIISSTSVVGKFNKLKRM